MGVAEVAKSPDFQIVGHVGIQRAPTHVSIIVTLVVRRATVRIVVKRAWIVTVIPRVAKDLA